jgi:hypothetical protein
MFQGHDDGGKTSECEFVKMQNGLWETSGMQAGATLGMPDISRSHGKCCQFRVRTWLQLQVMCCTLILELGVLI